jgi:hypothetical protein
MVVVTHDEINRALENRNGDTNVHTQIIGRPRKNWLLELGYFSDTRYMNKVTGKKEQHADLYKLLVAERYSVKLLPALLESAGPLFLFTICLGRAATKMDIPNTRKKKLYSKLHLHSIHSLQNLVSQRRYPQRQQQSTSAVRGRIKVGTSLPTPSRLTVFGFYLHLSPYSISRALTKAVCNQWSFSSICGAGLHADRLTGKIVKQ